MAIKKTTTRKAGARPTTTKKPALKASRPAASRPRAAAAADEAPSAARPKGPSKRAKKAQKALKLTRSDGPAITGVAASKQARETALLAADAALEKKALDVEILDVAGKVDYADLLVLMTGTSDRHVSSLVQSIEEELKKRKIRAIAVEGLPTANWVLIDFGDVVVHVFQEDARGLYDLSHLWMDATRIPVPTRAQGEAGRDAPARGLPRQPGASGVGRQLTREAGGMPQPGRGRPTPACPRRRGARGGSAARARCAVRSRPPA